MEEIKQLLIEGKTIKEIVELGYKKPSIYKCRKELQNKESPEPPEPPEPVKETKPFQEKVDEVPETILVDNNTGPDNTDTNIGDLLSNPKETKEKPEDGEPLIEELFGDDEQPFQDFNEVDIDRIHVNIDSNSNLHKPETKPADQGTGKLGTAELVTQVYSLIGITTGHDHWEVSSKEQKVLKNLCKIPALEKVLHKFGLYGCVISLITMTLKRIKIEMQLRKENLNENPDQENTPEPIIRSDAPSNIMSGFNDT